MLVHIGGHQQEITVNTKTNICLAPFGPINNSLFTSVNRINLGKPCGHDLMMTDQGGNVVSGLENH